ncbi:MAG: NUDIX hydrolase [Phascolarctobacterium faecium]
MSEETGYSAKEWQATSIVTHLASDEVIHLYAARGLEKHDQHTDEDEFIDVVKLTPQQVRKWCWKAISSILKL